MDNQLVVILEKSISPIQQELVEARDFLEKALVTQYEPVVAQLSQILANVNFSPVVRMQAGLQLKNVVFSNDLDQKQVKQNRWLSIMEDLRNQIKLNCFSALGTQQQGFHSAAQCVAYIACIEIPVNQWPNVIPSLVDNITGSTATESLKQASLEALGYICNEINANILASQSDNILTGIVFGMKKEEPSNRVKKAAVNALLNSLDFTRDNFSNEVERSYLMQVVCESTQCNDIEVAVIALQCLVRIMSQYYGHMEQYMSPAVFGITLGAMTSVEDAMVLQGIEFWSTICEEEIKLTLEAAKCLERGDPPPDIQCQNYARGALKDIVPILMRRLHYQGEVDDEEEWNPRQAAKKCLALLAQCYKYSIVDLVKYDVLEGSWSENWKEAESAIMAFGLILDGPSPSSLGIIFCHLLPTITIHLFGFLSQYPEVRHTAAWTIARFCEVLPEVALNDDCLPSLLQTMVSALSLESGVVTNVCLAIRSLAEGAYKVAMKALVEHDDHEQQIVPMSYKLSNYFDGLVQQLLVTTKRDDGAYIRRTAYNCLVELTRTAPQDCYNRIHITTEEVVGRIKTLLLMPDGPLNEQDIELLCGFLQSLLCKITRDDAMKICDIFAMELMDIVRGAQNAAQVKDALIAMGAIIQSIGPQFLDYLPQFMELLLPCLINVAEQQVWAAAVGVLRDLSRNLAGDLRPYLDTIFEILDGTLRNPETPRPLLPLIIATYGDFALQLGELFARYRSQVLVNLELAFNVEADLSDADFLNSLRSSCIDTLVNLIQGAKSDNPNENAKRLAFLRPHMESIVRYVENIDRQDLASDELIGACCGLIGDIATAFGKDSLQVLDTIAINRLVWSARHSDNVSTTRYAVWAYNEMEKLRSL